MSNSNDSSETGIKIFVGFIILTFWTACTIAITESYQERWAKAEVSRALLKVTARIAGDQDNEFQKKSDRQYGANEFHDALDWRLQ